MALAPAHPQLPAHGAQCTPPAAFLADPAVPPAPADVPASLPAVHAPASVHVQVSAHVLAEHPAPAECFPLPKAARPQASGPASGPDVAEATSVTKRPKKAR